MSGMEAFYTRDRANEGKRLLLNTPDGKPTDHWLQIRNQWSDAFMEAKAEFERALADLAGKPADEVKRGLAECKLDMLASCVGGWSFDQPCTHEAAKDFLRNAPQIAKQINGFAGDDSRFFRNGSPASTPGREPSSPSGKSRKARK